jgi:single-strand DNA-binding protein
MAYEISGTVKVIFETQTFGSGFSKREFVITTRDKFPQDIKLECLKDKTALLDNLEEGQSVNVQFDVTGREYNGRYFVNLVAWRVEAAEGDSAPGKPRKQDRKADEPPLPEDTTDYSRQDEPF